MSDEYTTTEYMTSEQIARTLSVMRSQLEKFHVEIILLRQFLNRTVPSEDCGDVLGDRHAIEDRCFNDKVIAKFGSRDHVKERIAFLEEKIQRLDVLIAKYRKLTSTIQPITSTQPEPNPALSRPAEHGSVRCPQTVAEILKDRRQKREAKIAQYEKVLANISDKTFRREVEQTLNALIAENERALKWMSETPTSKP